MSQKKIKSKRHCIESPASKNSSSQNLYLGYCYVVSTFPMVVICSCSTHAFFERLSARARRISSTSWMIHRPVCRNFRRLEQSMCLVKLSANCAAEWTHFTTTPSFSLSLMINASSMTLCSWHCGIVVFCIRSYRLLQSTTA